MNRFSFIKVLLAAAGTAFLPLSPGSLDGQILPDRPNIVWITTEDNSVHYLRLYTEGGAPMPNVERLASHGIVFNNAFSNAPVCSTARSTIISGCYGPRVFSQFHRASSRVPMPEGLHMFPWYLRKAGYHTSNNSKEDYNFIKGEGVWDESAKDASYRHRATGQPFFHVRNYETTHEGKLHFDREEMQSSPTVTDPQSVPVFPIHPDTALVRYTNARYRDLHMQMDREIGQLLDQLEEDGLMEDTIIIFFGDHGGALPGSKGYLYERGLHVPMVVHVPDKWRNLFPVPPGSRVEGFVQFVDLAPTVLNLAGLPVPGQMDGRPFLGQGISEAELNSRKTTFSHADRFDEKYDLVRAIRVGKYKYIRSYQPFNVDALQNNYRYRQPAYQEWRRMYQEGKLSPGQAQFFQPRPVEALFDLETDPFELNNLAGEAAHHEDLLDLREALRGWVRSMPDLSFIPEPVLLDEAAGNPVAYGQEQKGRIGQLVDLVDLSLLPFARAREGIVQALHSTDSLQRYWALVVCSCFGQEAGSLAGTARSLAHSDPDNLVRMRAAEFLGLAGLEDPRPVLADCLKASSSECEVALVLNSITLLHDQDNGWRFKLDREGLPEALVADPQSNVVRRFSYLESGQ